MVVCLHFTLGLQSPEYAAKGIELVADEMKAVAEGKGFVIFAPSFCIFNHLFIMYTLETY